MLQVAGHLFIISTYHNKQWQLRLDSSAAHQRKKWRGKKTKISGGQCKTNKKGARGVGDGENLEINHCNYVQEHRGGPGWYQ